MKRMDSKEITFPPFLQNLEQIDEKDQQIWKVAFDREGTIVYIENFYKPVTRLINFNFFENEGTGTKQK